MIDMAGVAGNHVVLSLAAFACTEAQSVALENSPRVCQGQLDELSADCDIVSQEHYDRGVVDGLEGSVSILRAGLLGGAVAVVVAAVAYVAGRLDQ